MSRKTVINRGTFGDVESERTGLYALENADLFTLLCLPGADARTVTNAAVYCEKRRAFLILDAPTAWDTMDKAKSAMSDPSMTLGTNSANAAVFFPWLNQRNPFQENKVQAFPACGAVAGMFARNDAQRGIWKAPAGTNAGLVGPVGPSVSLNNVENGELNPLGCNCIRSLPPFGTVVWGVRTLKGNDQFGSQWRYIPVRRLALFIEESVDRGTRWVVFEPNDEPLWSQIRLRIGSFMNDLFRQGALQGVLPSEAYFVRCDSTTTSQSDINRGIVNFEIGFAPLMPAEFLILRFQQIVGPA